jgi:hypothetical protein
MPKPITFSRIWRPGLDEVAQLASSIPAGPRTDGARDPNNGEVKGELIRVDAEIDGQRRA